MMLMVMRTTMTRLMTIHDDDEHADVEAGYDADGDEDDHDEAKDDADDDGDGNDEVVDDSR